MFSSRSRTNISSVIDGLDEGADGTTKTQHFF